MLVFALQATGARGQGYEFAAVSNSVTAGVSLSAVTAATNGNVFVCVGAANSPVLSVNTNNFGAFAAGNFGGGYLLSSSAWTNTLKSSIKSNSLDCITVQPGGFIASGASNAVYVSSDGVNWTNWGFVLPAGNESISIAQIAYNWVSGTFGAAQAYSAASWTTNPISTNTWQPATLLAPSSFTESFRAISSSGSSNMAMCGILGDIRISTDGGKTWMASRQPDSIVPNLVAVASDGSTNLVCAGGNSLIEVCTNGGLNGLNAPWTIQTNFNISTSGSVTDFNALAYSPTANAFLAAGTVGADGLIVMAPEAGSGGNWTWTGQTNLWTLKNGSLTQTNANLLNGATLNGAAFANSGFFQGIAMVVGNNGAVIIGGLPPPAPTNSTGNYVTNVLTNPQVNNLLGGAGNIVTDSNHPAGTVTIDWYSAPTGGIQLETNSPYVAPPGSMYGTCGTYTNWAGERDLRTGFSSTNRTPFVFYIVPGAPGNPMSATNCDPIGQSYGMCIPTPLSVTVVTNAVNPAGTIQVNWYMYTNQTISNIVYTYTNLVASDTYSNDSDIVSYLPTNLAPGFAYTFAAQATNPLTGFASANSTVLTFQLNALPQLSSSSPEVFTSLFTSPLTTGFLLPIPVIDNLDAVTNIEPNASVVLDYYTNGDPTVATFENPNPPLAGGVITNGIYFIPTNAMSGTYNFYARARVSDPNFTACACQSTNLIDITYVLLPPAPIDSIVGVTNVLGQTNAPIWVDVATNASNPATNFAVNWYAAATGTSKLNNSTDTNLNNRFFYVPTNTLCGVYTNWAETVAVTTGEGGPLTSTNRMPVVFTIVPAAPTAITPTAVNNCVEVPNPTFSVAAAGGQTVNWFAVPSTGTPLTNALSFTPTNSSVGTWTFSAVAVDSASGLSSTGAVTTTLTLYSCTNVPVISLNPANGMSTIQWPGNLTLLSTTNVTPPIVWTSVSAGTNFSAPNTFTFTNTNSPELFFRLTN